MQNPQSPEMKQNQSRVLYILWIALTVSLGLIMFVSYTSSPHEPGSAIPKIDLQANLIFVVIAAVLLFATNLVPALLLKGIVKTAKPASYQHVFVPFLVRMALNEAFVLIGFVIAGSQSDWRVMIPFFAVGVLRALSYKPTEKHLSEWVQKCGGTWV